MCLSVVASSYTSCCNAQKIIIKDKGSVTIRYTFSSSRVILQQDYRQMAAARLVSNMVPRFSDGFLLDFEKYSQGAWGIWYGELSL